MLSRQDHKLTPSIILSLHDDLYSTTSISSAAQTLDSHNWWTLPEPMGIAHRENYTTQAPRYLSSFAASYLLDAPSPARQRIRIPWGRFPSYVQQAIDLIICFKTKLLLENGNKLILQLELNIAFEHQKELQSFMNCSVAEAYMEIWIHTSTLRLLTKSLSKCDYFFLRNG